MKCHDMQLKEQKGIREKKEKEDGESSKNKDKEVDNGLIS